MANNRKLWLARRRVDRIAGEASFIQLGVVLAIASLCACSSPEQRSDPPDIDSPLGGVVVESQPETLLRIESIRVALLSERSATVALAIRNESGSVLEVSTFGLRSALNGLEISGNDGWEPAFVLNTDYLITPPEWEHDALIVPPGALHVAWLTFRAPTAPPSRMLLSSSGQRVAARIVACGVTVRSPGMFSTPNVSWEGMLTIESDGS